MEDRQASLMSHTLIVPAIRKQVAATERQIEMGIEVALDKLTDEMGTTEFTVLCVIDVLAAREDDLDEWLMENWSRGIHNSIRQAVELAPDGYTIRAPHNYLGYVYVLCDSRTHEFVMPMNETDLRNFRLITKP